MRQRAPLPNQTAAAGPQKPKLLGAHDHAQEREAHTIADRVAPPAAQTPVPAGSKSEPSELAPPIVNNELQRAGRPLDNSTRAFFEPHFGKDFSSVRIHADRSAGESASAVGARALAAGDHLVFGDGEYNPATSAGRGLIAHELAHSLQPHDAIRRQPLAPPATASFREVFHKFEMATDPAEEKRLALQALNLLNDFKDARAFGIPLADFFLKHGMSAEAEKVLSRVQDAATIGHATGLPTAQAGDPGVLVDRAKEAARADNHTLAFKLFGLAYQMLEFRAQEAGPKREESAEASREKAGTPDAAEIETAMGRIFFYADVRSIYDQMRDILGFYYVLEAESRAKGDANRAAYYSGLALMLYREIRDEWTWHDSRSRPERGDQTPMGDQLPVAEVELVEKGKRDALRLHGDNNQEVDLTALPGLPPPKEVTPSPKAGSVTTQTQETGAFTDALFGQVSFLAELNANADIQKEFGKQPIDMKNLSDRLRIWRVMYRQYQKEDTLGLGALYSLMSLIGRYLKAFTLHTEYNVPDFGVPSYLADNESTMPSDLASRLERDCGVYALTVAYEVFRTAREAKPALPVEFKLYAVPDHVALVVIDHSQNDYYVVNNDQISPPKKGEPDKEVANLYESIPNVKNLVTPAMTVPLGSTKMSDADFKKQAWQRYQDSASWSLKVTPKPGQDPAEAQKEAYESFYTGQQDFAKNSELLDRAVDRVVTDLRSAATAEVEKKYRDPLRSLAFQTAGLFYKLGPGVNIQTSRPDPKLRERLKGYGGVRYLYTSERPGSPNPIARAAMALLFFASLRGPLTDSEKAMVDLCDRVPAFKAAVDAYKASGMPPRF
jgi:hypothetical protein